MGKVSEFSAEQLWAFVDGEADSKSAREILVLERRDPTFAERIRQLRETNADVQCVLAADLRPAPPHLKAMIDERIDDRSGKSPFGFKTFAAVAAAVVLAAGLGASIGEYRFNDRLAALETEKQVQRLLVTQLMQEALERRLSGEAESATLENASFSARITPTRTYRSKSGHWCREFEEVLAVADPPLTREVVACRIDGGWRRMRTTIEGDTVSSDL